MKLQGTARESVAEGVGTFVLILFGLGVNAQVALGEGEFGDFFSVNIGWGIAVTMGVYVSGGISGGHINPAVTLALALCRKFEWRKVLPYVLAQMIGAFLASAVVYVTYIEALNDHDPGRTVVGETATAGIWATYPQPYLSNFPGAFLDQVVGTAMLLLMILALTDRKNLAPTSNLGPVIIGAIVFMVGMSFGMNAGYAINPARDLSPRLFTAVAGWGPEVFTAGNAFWWVPVVGPLVGGALGAVLYELTIARHHDEEA